MTASTTAQDAASAAAPAAQKVLHVREHCVEVVSDSGEGAQKCGQSFGSVSAKMGNGVWTVEIIPAEIQPPARTEAGASGVRIRLGTGPVTNGGDHAQLVVAFNEQVLLARLRQHALADDAIILLENCWATADDDDTRTAWRNAREELAQHSFRIIEVPMEELCLTVVDDPRKGKNMFVLGLLGAIYDRDVERCKEQIAFAFRKKSQEIYERNERLFDLGYDWARTNLDFRIDLPTRPYEQDMIVMNGNTALGMGAIAAGMDLCAMYPITPATSVSHYLSDVFESAGGVVHQAEDEIAAAGVAVGASYAGKVAFTVTSGPGLALKTEFLGLAVMTEVPLVVIDVQRGGPSTGMPTKIEQSDLLAALWGQPGDAPKVILAPSTIEECFHVVVTARRIAEAFRAVVFVLSDANLATGVTPFTRPKPDARWMAGPIDQSPVAEGERPYDWDAKTGLSKRFIPGQAGGMHTLTGLVHDENSKVRYAPGVNERACEMRSRKIAVLQSTLEPPTPHGPDSGDLLVVGWGSTRGAIEEAVDRAREDGLSVSSVNLTFLSPLEPGLTELFSRFGAVMTVEVNYSDEKDAPYITAENRRRGQLCTLLRAQTLVDVDCWTRVPGAPIRPADILNAIRAKVAEGGRS